MENRGHPEPGVMLLKWTNQGEPHPHSHLFFITLLYPSLRFSHKDCSLFIKSTNLEFDCISRKGPLSYRTPDFSMVEPKVHFPKGGYKPPKSKCSSKRDSLSPEPPLVFKSPADIVKEVLLNTTDGSPASSDYDRLPTRALNSTVPQEFRCRQQATTLLDQLQVLVETKST